MKNSLLAALLLSAVFAPSARAAAAADDQSGNDLLCLSWGCVGGSAFAKAETFHGSADGDWGSNDGPAAGVDLAVPLPVLGGYGVGVQASAGYGWYTFDGKGSNNNVQQLQRQLLYSLGVFRRPDVDGEWWSRWGLGAVEDVAVNHAFGTEQDHFTIHQFRAKASYVIHGGNEMGVWTAFGGRTSTVFNSHTFTANKLDSFRAADQTNVFYRYSFANGGHAGFYWGPGRAHQVSRISNSPYEFKYTVGADVAAPLSDYAQAFGGFAYARPSITPRMSDEGQIRRTYQLSAGVRVLWGGNARVRDNSGRHWMPYLDDTDNGNMMTVSNMDD